jgi:hypothetical protein
VEKNLLIYLRNVSFRFRGFGLRRRKGKNNISRVWWFVAEG